ncbi:MAG: apolipoprotein N-acyltransferase [Crocinitomicaceae bacterium]|nr:apolipoprotein N-acyltransferase [Crocinitomicaceae bacterium]
MKNYLLVLLSSALLILSFPYTGSFTPFVFIGLVPLFLLRQQFLASTQNPWKLGLWTYLTFLFWNLGTTWWVANASVSGGIFAFTVNALLMTLVFGLWSFIDRKIQTRYSFFMLIPIWLLFEFGHHRWDLSWPWLSLGNYFSVRTGWVQWYEWTGTLGGSAWILLVNLLVFRLYCVYRIVAKRNQYIFTILGVLLLPIVTSQVLQIFVLPTLQPKQLHAVVVQPNIDPYKEKFALSASNEAFADSIVVLANRHVTAQTDLVLAPETALPLSFQEERFHTFAFGQSLASQVQKWPQANLLIGASTVRIFDGKQSVASTPIPNASEWYESYNTSMLLTKTAPPQYAHKSKLVPGVELVPFSAYLPFLSAIAIENGGSSGTLGVEKEPKVMTIQPNVTLAPIICYESIYGDFVRQQVQKGAQALCVITNDGWWGNTPGYKQHFSFARLRAIENRRWVLRSANTGTSGSIDPSGKIIKKTPYWVKTAFSQTIQLRSDQTFYTTYGDWLAGLSISWILLSFSIFFKQIGKNSRKLQA